MTLEVICPHCGYQLYSTEYGTFGIKCANCGKTVWYTTNKENNKENIDD